MMRASSDSNLKSIAYPTSCKTSCIHTRESSLCIQEGLHNHDSNTSANTLNDTVDVLRFVITCCNGRHASDPGRTSSMPSGVIVAHSLIGARDHCRSWFSQLKEGTIVDLDEGLAQVVEGTDSEPP